MEERLHKFMAHCGVASRRKCEELIAEGRVRVNDEVVTEFGVKVDPGADRVTVDGRRVRPERTVSLLLHKPPGVTTTASDEYGRATVLDLVDVPERVYPVGRLDRDSEGLLVLTNDGDLAYYLTHPSNEVEKVYVATVRGTVADQAIETLLTKGIRLGPVLIRAIAATVLHRDADKTVVEVTVGEGINREIRRLFAALGHKVTRLVRTRVGPLRLKGLARGEWRLLTSRERATLQKGMRRAEKRKSAREAGELPPAPGRSRVYGRGTRPSGKPDPAAATPRKKRTSASAGARPSPPSTPATAAAAPKPTPGSPPRRKAPPAAKPATLHPLARKAKPRSAPPATGEGRTGSSGPRKPASGAGGAFRRGTSPGPTRPPGKTTRTKRPKGTKESRGSQRAAKGTKGTKGTTRRKPGGRAKRGKGRS
jgi:23S rRNA pseudouridine2605 synthase